jgi:hypothetical protein
MFGDAGLLHLQSLYQLPDGLLAVLEMFDDGEPERMRQGLQEVGFELKNDFFAVHLFPE